MADPISIFPGFTRNQAFPPSGAIPQTVIVERINVSVKAQSVNVVVAQSTINVEVKPESITTQVPQP